MRIRPRKTIQNIRQREKLGQQLEDWSFVWMIRFLEQRKRVSAN